MKQMTTKAPLEAEVPEIGEISGSENDQQEELDESQVDEAMETLMKAQEIMDDKQLMQAIQQKMDSHQAGMEKIKSLSDLKAKAAKV